MVDIALWSKTAPVISRLLYKSVLLAHVVPQRLHRAPAPITPSGIASVENCYLDSSSKSRASPSLLPVPRLSHLTSSMTLTPQPHFRRPREEVSKTSRTSRLSHFSQSRNTLPVFEIHYSTLKVQHSPCVSKRSTTLASRQEPEGADNGSHIVMVNDPL